MTIQSKNGKPPLAMDLKMLVFPSVDKLIRFQLAAAPKILAVNLVKNMLVCSCTEDQVELASYVYGALSLDLQGSLN